MRIVQACPDGLFPRCEPAQGTDSHRRSAPSSCGQRDTLCVGSKRGRLDAARPNLTAPVPYAPPLRADHGPSSASERPSRGGAAVGASRPLSQRTRHGRNG